MTAAVLTVGTELTEGLRLDTNSNHVSRSLSAAGLRVVEHASVPDDRRAIAEAVSRLTAVHGLVVVTGGLGPTHDDVTREATADALGIGLTRDAGLEKRLRASASPHTNTVARAQLLRQADVLDGARVLDAVAGTAPAQVVGTPAGEVLLLPGPPRELRPLLAAYLTSRAGTPVPRVTLGVVGMTESDVQVTVWRAIARHTGVRLTVLASPGLVDVVLFGDGAGEGTLREAAADVETALGDSCFAHDGATLAETVIRLARSSGARLATAESCTGGMVAAALTDVPGSSEAFLGGVIAYSDPAKLELLGVPADVLRTDGAVSEKTALAMASGARHRMGADIAVAVTGVAGPGGGTRRKPVGTVWLAVCDATGATASRRAFRGGRDRVREHATVVALDMLRRSLTAG